MNPHVAHSKGGIVGKLKACSYAEYPPPLIEKNNTIGIVLHNWRRYMSININSEAACRKAYLNYHCYGNSMNISADEMGEITKKWESKLNSWQATVSNDENQYEFDDSDYANSKEDGKKQGEEATGGKPSTAAGAAQSYGSGIGALGSAVCAAVALAKKGGSKVLMWVAAGLCAAVPITYYAHKPNKDGKQACDAMQNEMTNAQAALSETQADMKNMANELIELSDEANEANEDANDNLEEQKTEYDMYRESYEALKAKDESGEPLTEEEKALYQELVKSMSETGENIEETQENTTDIVGDIYEDMGSYQEGYDYAAESMGEVEGLTDYAESFDGKVKSNCYAAETALYMNAAASGIVAAKLALDFNMFTKAVSTAMGVVALAAGTTSTIAAKEQHDWAGQVGTEIDLRKDTQSFNTETMDMYTEEIDTYDGHMTGVEDLELEIPDDVEAPEDTALPPTTGDGLPEGTPEPIKPDKKEEEKNSR